MGNNQKALRVGLHTYLSAASNLFITAINDRLYYHEAEQGEALPYAVVDIIDSDENRDSVSKMFNHDVQILIAAISLTTVEDVMEKLLNRLDDAEDSLTVTNYAVLLIKKNFQSQPQKIEGVWQQIVNYSILLDQ